MRLLRNEKGVALVTALLLMMIALAAVMTLLYLVTSSTRMSASTKQYRTALEASYGGTEVVTKEIIPKMFGTYSTSSLKRSFSYINLDIPVTNACLNAKLKTATRQWAAVCGSSPDLTSMDPKRSPDMTFLLQGISGQPRFQVFSKIVDTVPGNSDTSGLDLLDSGDGVTGVAPGVSPKHVPAIYRIEVQGERETNPQENAGVSVLYIY